MPIDLPPEFWATGAPWGLIGVFVLLIAFGLLVPSRTVKTREKDWVARLQESKEYGDGWEQIARGMIALSDKRSDEMEKLLAGNQATAGLLRSINEAVAARKDAT
jgi:hypothetical protein